MKIGKYIPAIEAEEEKERSTSLPRRRSVRFSINLKFYRTSWIKNVHFFHYLLTKTESIFIKRSTQYLEKIQNLKKCMRCHTFSRIRRDFSIFIFFMILFSLWFWLVENVLEKNIFTQPGLPWTLKNTCIMWIYIPPPFSYKYT